MERLSPASPTKGFLLNGSEVLLKGACIHHDNGILGAAAYKSAEYRKIEILKKNGFNAIRTAHNPPSKILLDACDQMGMLVIDESFDQWQRPKNEKDYSISFDEWWEKDIESMILRDRNHPSIIIWSFGNEISERADSSGLVIAKKLIDKIHTLDPSRPATQAICKFWEHPEKIWKDSESAFALLDVHSYNYQWQQYKEDHQNFPERVMLGTESFALEAHENWKMVETHPYVIGDFVWTGMDYFGESGIAHTIYKDNKEEEWLGLADWPWFNAWCGDIDILGFKKLNPIFEMSSGKTVTWKSQCTSRSPMEWLNI
ncbi:MAG: hypothetical protein IPL46_20435 [Saprospiraceae bacterium]|nr:hypothetical protein [Saprospiraceae bacterium]